MSSTVSDTAQPESGGGDRIMLAITKNAVVGIQELGRAQVKAPTCLIAKSTYSCTQPYGLLESFPPTVSTNLLVLVQSPTRLARVAGTDTKGISFATVRM